MKHFLALALSFALSSPALAGAWGTGSFENDDALDWAAQCTQSSGPPAVAAALKAALSADFIEAPDGAMAIAAAEVVAAARGKPGAKLPDTLRAWLQRQPQSQIARLAPLAQQALARVNGSADQSELKQLWSGKDAQTWNKLMANLAARLR